MSDLITLTGPLVDHQGAAPLPGVTVTATPSRDITRTSDGEDALTGAAATTDETGTFELELVHAAGLRYLIQYRVQGKVLRPYILDCDSWPAGSTVTIADLPPIAGVPPSAVEDLQAWLLARLAEGGGGALTGTGQPTGTAAPGATYVDTATTAGASIWVYDGVKWVVTIGDTGWRDLGTLAVAPYDPALTQFIIRRVGDLVFLIRAVTYMAANGGADSDDPTTVLTLPEGFRSAGFFMVPGTKPMQIGGAWLTGTSSSDSVEIGMTFPMLTWPAYEPWPATLPGVPPS